MFWVYNKDEQRFDLLYTLFVWAGKEKAVMRYGRDTTTTGSDGQAYDFIRCCKV